MPSQLGAQHPRSLDAERHLTPVVGSILESARPLLSNFFVTRLRLRCSPRSQFALGGEADSASPVYKSILPPGSPLASRHCKRTSRRSRRALSVAGAEQQLE